MLWRSGSRVSALLERRLASPFAGDSHEYPDREPAGEHERSAVAEELKRNSSERHEVQLHADVHENVNEPARHQSKRDKRAEGIVGSAGDLCDAKKKREKQGERDGHSNKAHLLAHHRKNEVGVLLRQECQSFLRSERKSFSEEATRPNRNLRLDDVVSRCARIGRWIDESLEAILLIRRELFP